MDIWNLVFVAPYPHKRQGPSFWFFLVLRIMHENDAFILVEIDKPV
jgi:hypothetical protein